MNTPPLLGLHHVTAVTADARANRTFYTRALGLRLVKRTVNQDDVSSYHLFYGDALGRPGSELTFFEWSHVGPTVPGAGTVSETALTVPGDADTLARWLPWLEAHGASRGAVEDDPAGSGRPSLAFLDPEGQRLRLVAAQSGDSRPAFTPAPWPTGSAGPGPAAAGLHAVTLCVRRPEPTARVLTEVLGLRPTGGGGDTFGFAAEGDAPNAQRVRLEVDPSPRGGRTGAGGVHHVAFRVADAAGLTRWRQHVVAAGLGISEEIDRHYFRSLYFREPGGILFEIATDGPGFSADGEDPATLGERLSLPPFLEKRRASIEAGLAPLD